MASFNSSSIQFTPYTPAYNTSLYQQIGMQKQDAYNQGVRQSQSYIDSVVNLPVGPEVDKQYLQQKMQQVTSTVNSLAGRDFSDQRIIGQIQSVAASIANDPIVQSSVSAAMKYKKEAVLAETARKEGKSSSSNDWDFQKQANAWMNSTQAGTPFNGSYTPYRDVKKKWLEVVQKLANDSSITDDAFTVDSNGQTIISDAVVRTKLAGVSPDRLKTAIASVTDAGDYQQLAIDGRYNYSNKSPEEFAGMIAENHQYQAAPLVAERNRLQGQLEGISDGGQKIALQNKINDVNKQIKSVAEDNNQYIDTIKNGNVEQAKASYYTTNQLRSFANSFSHQERAQTLETSPYAQLAMERSKMAQTAQLQLNKMTQEDAHFKLTYDQKERHHKEDNDVASGEYGRVPLAADQKALPNITLGVFQDRTKELQTTLDKSQNDFLKSQGHEGDREWLTIQRMQYDKDPSSVTASIKDYFNTSIDQEKQLQTSQQLITTVSREADKQFGDVKNLIPADAKGISINNGQTAYHFTPEELTIFKKKYDALDSHPTTLDESKVYGENNRKHIQNVKENFSDKEQVLYKSIAEPRKNTFNGFLNPSLTTSEEILGSTMNYYGKVAKQYGDVLEKKNKFIADQLAERTGETTRSSIQLPTGKTEQRDAVRGMVSSFINRAADQKNSLGDGVDVSELSKINEDKDAIYHLVVKGKTQFGEPKYWLDASVDGKSQRFELQPGDKEKIFGNRYENTTQDNFSMIDNRIRMTGNQSTNFSGTFDPVKASVNPLFSHTDFNQVQNFNVSGDVYQQNGRYGIALYVVNPLTQKMQRVEYAPPSGLMDKNQVMQVIPNINDGVIYELLTGQKLTPEALSKIQQYNKTAH